MATVASSYKSIGGIIVAGGSGNRFGSETPKQFLTLGNRWVIEWSLEQFYRSEVIEHIVVVVPADWLTVCRERWESYQPKLSAVVAGGATRFQSVANGLAALPDCTQVVLIHDAARPGVTTQLIQTVTDAALQCGAALPVTPVAATVKRIAGEYVTGTLDRNELALAQTPQGFQLDLLRTAIAASPENIQSVTDEIQLIEALKSGRVKWVAGSPRNEKITTSDDFTRIEQLLTGNINMEIRTGIGYDVHQFASGRALVLGGVPIPAEMGLLGHSDADVLCHAIADAVLGAAALGDIGVHFPDTDPAWKGVSSLILLKRVAELITETGYSITNIDATLILETPKVMPFAAEMRANIAFSLDLQVEQISVKATTNERLGFIGRKEGAAAMAIATLRRAVRG